MHGLGERPTGGSVMACAGMESVVGCKVQGAQRGVLLYDSHFHMDRSCRNLGLTVPASLQDLERRRSAVSGSAGLGGGVAVYCDPATYPSEGEIRRLVEGNVVAAVGIHPKSAGTLTDEVRHRLSALLRSPLVVGLGEVGLDHSVPSSEWGIQQDCLQTVLQFLEPRHVLVLHCRGMRGQSSEEAYCSMLYQLISSVPSEQRIHLHCFSGNRRVYERWSRYFPNTFYGLTRMVASVGPDDLDGIRMVPQNQLLLETDAPYFKCPTPHSLGEVAEAVGKRLKLDPSELLAITARNGAQLYGYHLRG